MTKQYLVFIIIYYLFSTVFLFRDSNTHDMQDSRKCMKVLQDYMTLKKIKCLSIVSNQWLDTIVPSPEFVSLNINLEFLNLPESMTKD